MPKILVVDDDKNQNQAIAEWFSDRGHSVDQAFTCLDAETYLSVSSYDLVILDWNLPDGEGTDVMGRMRRRGVATPVLMLTGKSSLDDKEVGFECGADDYLTNPFHDRELQVRVKALLRRPQTYVEEVIQIGELRIYQTEKVAKAFETAIPLTPKEFDILLFLARNPNTVFSTDLILQRIWQTDSETTPDNIRKHIQRLRAKLEGSGFPDLIETHHGIGYSCRTKR